MCSNPGRSAPLIKRELELAGRLRAGPVSVSTIQGGLARPGLSGPPSVLFRLLRDRAGDEAKADGWPKRADGLSRRLDVLTDLTRPWQRGLDEQLTEHPQNSEYIESLEAQQDETGLPQATGDSIAREFERYLRRRGTDGPGPQS